MSNIKNSPLRLIWLSQLSATYRLVLKPMRHELLTDVDIDLFQAFITPIRELVGHTWRNNDNLARMSLQHSGVNGEARYAFLYDENLFVRVLMQPYTGYFFLLPAVLWATAARMRSLSPGSSISSSSPKSMARVAFASNPALNRLFGSSNDAPLKKFSFT